ncbi:DUF1641 domain-containing protein [candidate division KSB1 bacterium]
MAEVKIENQINEINQKLDFVIEHVNQQRLKQQSIEDLVEDLSIVGKDVFQNTVKELDRAGVEMDSEALSNLGLKLIRNIGTINEMFDLLISTNDFIKDVSPVLKEMGLDAIHKINDLEKKGYMDFIKELAKISDNIVTHFSVDDVRMLSDNVVTILETVKNLTQPDMLSAMNNAMKIYKNLETTEIEEYSLWRAFKEMRSPEMKRGIGFIITFLKNLTKEEIERTTHKQISN